MKKILKRNENNLYIIPHNVISDMEDLIRKTHITKKEHGMSLCSSNDNIIRSGFKTIGTDRGIVISEKCKKTNEYYVGSYHTHPDDSETSASAQDLFSSCLSISNLDCIGKNSKGEIVCYEKKNKNKSCLKDAKPMKDVEDILHNVPYGEVDDLKKEMYAEVDRIADRHFNIQKIK